MYINHAFYSRTTSRIERQRRRARPRPYKCKNCNRGFGLEANLEQHMLTHKVTKVLDPGEMTMPLPCKWYYKHLKLASQKPELKSEFIVDGLHILEKKGLVCTSYGQQCYVTKHVSDMRKHRELFHPLLDKRFGFECWSTILADIVDKPVNDVVNNNFEVSFKKVNRKKR